MKIDTRKIHYTSIQFVLMFFFLIDTQSVLASNSCQVVLSTCPKQPTAPKGAFIDNYSMSSNSQNTCMQRANDYYNWCGGSSVMNGNTVTTNFFSDTTLLKSAIAGSTCQISLPSCPAQVGAPIGSFTDNYSVSSSSQNTCKQRAYDYYNWCGGPSVMAGQTVTASYFSNGQVVESTNAGISYEMSTYWPQPPAGTAMLRNWTGLDGASYGFQKIYLSPFSGTYYLVDIDAKYNWLDTWNYQVNSQRGVLETGDQFPNGTNLSFAVGGEIFWGKSLAPPVNGQVQYVCQSIITTSGSNFGYQCLGMIGVLPTHSFSIQGKPHTFQNVLKIVVNQNEIHLVYYMAPQLGIIQIDYYDANWTNPQSWYANAICMGGLGNFSCSDSH